jgi:ribonucleoside-diphosphate reductase alpha chain
VSDLEGFARWTDSACSKTCNIPFDYPYADFKDLYLKVYNTGIIKGFTTYRAGTMATVLSAKDEKHAGPADEEIILDTVSLPDSAPASMKTLKAEDRKWYLSVVWNERQTRPFALFVHTNHHEKNVTTSDAVEKLTDLAVRKKIPQVYIDEVLAKISGNDNASKIARMISLNLRHGVLIKNIVNVLDSMEDIYIGSFLFQIKKYLASFIKDGETVQDEVCQECGSTNVIYEEGCKKCVNCGSGKCS